MVDRDPSAQYDMQYARPPLLPGVLPVTESDLLPHPPTFKTTDVEREVNAVRDARRRIRLEPSALNNIDINSPQANTARARALPSICAYTLHNVVEGYVQFLLRGGFLTPFQSTLHGLFSRYVLNGRWFR